MEWDVSSGDLESKQAEAARLKRERHEMEKKLKLYESKVLQADQSDGESMAEKAAAREAFLQQKRVELESRCVLHRNEAQTDSYHLFLVKGCWKSNSQMNLLQES